MGEIIPLIPYSKSRVELDWACARKRYWQYGYSGHGITTSNTSLELYLGTVLHDGLAGIARGLAIDEIAELARKQVIDTLLVDSVGLQEEVEFAHEQSALVEGLLRGFAKAVWPRLSAEYPKVVALEDDLEYHHDGLVFMSRPDLVLANDTSTVYVEYKSTSSKKESWITSWSTAVQLHSTVAALKQAKGIEVDQIIVQGLYKGYESYGKQNSPFCYGFRRTGTPPFSEDQESYEYKPGFKRFPTWEMEGGVKDWVEEMPVEILAQQFPQTPPIFVKWDLVEHFFRQRAAREHEIHEAVVQMESLDADGKSLLLDSCFPQNFSECQPAWGRGCQYRSLCFGSPDANPLDMGFVWKEASPQEAKLLDNSGKSG